MREGIGLGDGSFDMLGKRISALRKEKGMSQAQLAQALNLSASTVGMYEQGRRDPSLDILISLARMLEVSTDFLLTGSDSAFVGGNQDRFWLMKGIGDADAMQNQNESSIAIVADGTGKSR